MGAEFCGGSEMNETKNFYSKHFEGLKSGVESGFWKMGGKTQTSSYPNTILLYLIS